MNKRFTKFGFIALLLLVLTTSCNYKKKEEQIINTMINKVWFTTKEERWNTDYSNNLIPESQREWEYYKIPGSENWLWYFFENNIGYLIHTEDFDTIYYQFEYSYRYKNNDFFVKFQTVDGTSEEYHAQIDHIDNYNFIFQHEYRFHSFEKITNENVTASKRGGEFNINPEKIKLKPSGPLIQVE